MTPSGCFRDQISSSAQVLHNCYINALNYFSLYQTFVLNVWILNEFLHIWLRCVKSSLNDSLFQHRVWTGAASQYFGSFCLNLFSFKTSAVFFCWFRSRVQLLRLKTQRFLWRCFTIKVFKMTKEQGAFTLLAVIPRRAAGFVTSALSAGRCDEQNRHWLCGHSLQM